MADVMFTLIIFTWEPPIYHEDDILRYVIRYKVGLEPQVELKIHDHSFTLSELMPDTFVTFTIIAENSQGLGRPYPLDILKTEAVPREIIVN